MCEVVTRTGDGAYPDVPHAVDAFNPEREHTELACLAKRVVAECLDEHCHLVPLGHEPVTNVVRSRRHALGRICVVVHDPKTHVDESSRTSVGNRSISGCTDLASGQVEHFRREVFDSFSETRVWHRDHHEIE